MCWCVLGGSAKVGIRAGLPLTLTPRVLVYGGLFHGSKESGFGKEVWRGSGPSRGKHSTLLPLPAMEGCDSLMQAFPLNVPLAQSRSFYAGQTLVQRLRLRQASSLSPTVPLSKLHRLVHSVS